MPDISPILCFVCAAVGTLIALKGAEYAASHGLMILSWTWFIGVITLVFWLVIILFPPR